MDDLALSAAPNPDAVPSPTARPVAYVDLDRAGVVADREHVVVHDVRVDGVGAALAELPGRDGPAGWALAEAVETWHAAGDLDGAAGVLAGGKKPHPWVVAERPPLALGHTARGDGPAVPLDLDHALWVGARLADTLAAAHDRGVVHGALTPTTVRAWPAPTPETWPLPRVADWGLARARLTPAVGDTEPVAVVGAGDTRGPPAVAFLAPAWAGDRASSPEPTAEDTAPAPPSAVDVYGVGALLYWLLTGATARDGPADDGRPVPPSTMAPTLPSAVDDPVLAALATAPGDRPTAAELRTDLLDRLRAETGADDATTETAADAGPGTATTDDATAGLPTAFPLFDGSRADWRAPCPDCGRSVNNTVSSFVDHWVDADRCAGPPARPPAAVTGLSDREYARVVETVERLRHERASHDTGLGDHPLVEALADDTRTVDGVAGVAVDRTDGGFPWLDHPGRGWRVPCPDCDAPVFNALSAFRSHWADAPDCAGPPDTFSTR